MSIISPELRSKAISYSCCVVASAILTLFAEHGIPGDDSQPKQLPASKDIATESVLKAGTHAYNHMRGGFHCGKLVTEEHVTIRIVAGTEGGVPPSRAEVTAVDGKLETTLGGIGCGSNKLWVSLNQLPEATTTHPMPEPSHLK